MATFFRKDGWIKSAIGPAVPGAQIYVCAPQPTNVDAVPPSPLTNIFADSFGLVPITQPIITDGFGHYFYYSEAKLATEVVALGGVIQQVYIDQTIGGFGTSNPPGNNTGLVAGSNITIIGNVISSTASGGGIEVEVDGVPTTDQALANFTSTPSIVWTSDGAGGLFAAVATLPAAQAINNSRIWKAIPNSGSIGDTIGFSATAVSSSSSLITATAADTNYTSWSTSSVGGNQASVSFCGSIGSGLSPNVFQIYTRQTLQTAKWRVLVPDIANVRVWVGLADVSSSLVANLISDSPVGLSALMAFRYSTAAGDTTWHAVCNDGGGQTVVNTGIPATTSGITFTITPVGSSVEFRINNVLVATISTNVPSNTVRFGDITAVDNVGLANVKTVALNLVATLEP
jgi:hypothetical protein